MPFILFFMSCMRVPPSDYVIHCLRALLCWSIVSLDVSFLESSRFTMLHRSGPRKLLCVPTICTIMVMGYVRYRLYGCTPCSSDYAFVAFYVSSLPYIIQSCLSCLSGMARVPFKQGLSRSSGNEMPAASSRFLVLSGHYST